MSDIRRCVGGCCDNRPGWAYDATTGTRERLPAQPGQHGTEGHECQPRTTDSSYLCRPCERFLGDLIRDMPTYATDLQRAITHSAGSQAGSQREKPKPSPAWGRTGVKGGKSGEASPDFAGPRRRAEALGQLAHDVTWWVRHVSGERGLATPELHPDMHVLTVWRGCRWLHRHTSWLAARPDAADTVTAWKALRGDAARAMDLPRDRAQFDVGPCPEDACDGTVRAFIGTENNDSAMGCDTNPDHQWNPAQFYRAGLRIKRKMEGAA